MSVPEVLQTGYSRVFLLKNRAGPTTVPQFMGYWRAGALSFDRGDKTRIFVPDDDQYGGFHSVSSFRGAPGNAEMTLTARHTMQISDMLKLATGDCEHDVQIHFGICTNPKEFNLGWQKVLVIAGWSPTNYSTDELGALGPDEQAVVNEMLDIAGDSAYEIKALSFAAKAGSQVINEVMDIIFCDAQTCGLCGISSDGCQVILAVTKSTGDSPGLSGEVVYSIDGGTTWNDENVLAMPAGKNPRAIACFGSYAVIASSDDDAWYYSLMTDVLAGSEILWERSAFGIGASGGPLGMFSADASHLYSIGEVSRLYLMENLQDDATILHRSGDVTTELFLAIHGIDNQQFVISADNNVILVTRDGGTVLTLVTGPEPAANLTAIWMVSDNVWWVGTDTANLYYTIDGGVNWVLKKFPGYTFGGITDIKFSTPSVGYMTHTNATPRGRILRTIDGGNSWLAMPQAPGQSLPTNTNLNKLAVCPDPNVVLAGGNATLDGIIVQGG